MVEKHPSADTYSNNAPPLSCKRDKFLFDFFLDYNFAQFFFCSTYVGSSLKPLAKNTSS